MKAYRSQTCGIFRGEERDQLLSNKKDASSGNSDRNNLKLYCSRELFKKEMVVLVLQFEGLRLQNRHKKTGCRSRREEEGRNVIVHGFPKSHGTSLRVKYGTANSPNFVSNLF